MTENKKLIVKSSYNFPRFGPNGRKELVVRGLNALMDVEDADFYFFKGERHRIIGGLSEAISYYKKRDYEKARGAFKQAIRSNPDYARAHYGLGLAYHELERYNESVWYNYNRIMVKLFII